MKSTDKKNRLAAILALSADKGKPAVKECISSEDLALLLESKLTSDEKQRWLEHLSLCESCYQQWTLLKKTQEPDEKNNIIPIYKRVSYKYIGSSLAVAATIAVFLNIYEPPTSEMSPTLSDKAVLEERVYSEQETASDSVQKREKSHPKELLEKKIAPSKSQHYLEKVTPSSNLPQSEVRINSAKSPLPAPSIDNKLQSSGSVAVMTAPKRRAKKKIASVLDEFVEQIRVGCGREDYDPQLWASVIELTEKVEPSKGEWSSRENLSSVRQLLKTMDETNWKSRCVEMESLLAEEEKSR